MSSLAPDSNQMALDRTWLAHERTLMAWVRTATSMISFGFTIYKFFQFEVAKDAPIRHGLLTPRDFALIMVSIGLVSLLAATVSHRREGSGLRPLLSGRHSLAEVIAYFVSIFGILVLLSTLFRH
jgi:putative membrane protein